jgi:hypothetical protein
MSKKKSIKPQLNFRNTILKDMSNLKNKNFENTWDDLCDFITDNKLK